MLTTNPLYPAPTSDGDWSGDSLGQVPNSQDNVDASGKLQVGTPVEGSRTAVIVVAGQSYTGNMPATDPDAYASIYAPAGQVTQLDVDNGLFYKADDPLLGVGGVGGTMWTREADDLIESGQYDNVVIVDVGVGGTFAHQWSPYDPTTGQPGILWPRIVAAFKDLQQDGLAPTQFIWEQGIAESVSTPPATYEAEVDSIFGSLIAHGMTAPMYMAVNSLNLGAGSGYSDPTLRGAQEAFAAAQGGIADTLSGANIRAGVNFDALPTTDYSYDGHFTTQGLIDSGLQWMDAFAGPPNIALTGDFIVARDATAAQTGIGVLSGDAITPVNISTLDRDWHMVGSGLDRGEPEIVLRAADGETCVQLTNGQQSDGGGEIPGSPFQGNSWQIAALQDLNGDGNTDIVWRNSTNGDVQVLNLDGNNPLGGGELSAEYFNADWQLILSGHDQTMGDFLIYRDVVNQVNETCVEYVHGQTLDGPNGLILNDLYGGANWEPIGMIDARGTGSADDIVWENTDNKDIQVQYLNLNDHSVAGGGEVQGSPFDHVNWQPVGVADGNSLILQNRADGQLAREVIDGTTVASASALAVNSSDFNVASMFGALAYTHFSG